MNFAVAGIVWLIAILVGMTSYLAIPYYQKDGLKEHQVVGGLQSLWQQIHAFFLRKNWKQWSFLLVTSLLCAASSFIVSKAEPEVLVICKWICIMLALLSAMIIDRQTHRIPNVIVLTLLASGVLLLVAEFFSSDEPAWLSLITSLAGLLGCVVLFYALSRITKDGIGMGDVKIIAAMGGILGLMTTLVIVLISLVFCTLSALVLLIRKKKNKSDSIPFGPFLFFGYIASLFMIYL